MKNNSPLKIAVISALIFLLIYINLIIKYNNLLGNYHNLEIAYNASYNQNKPLLFIDDDNASFQDYIIQYGNKSCYFSEDIDFHEIACFSFFNGSWLPDAIYHYNNNTISLYRHNINKIKFVEVPRHE